MASVSSISNGVMASLQMIFGTFQVRDLHERLTYSNHVFDVSLGAIEFSKLGRKLSSLPPGSD